MKNIETLFNSNMMPVIVSFVSFIFTSIIMNSNKRYDIYNYRWKMVVKRLLVLLVMCPIIYTYLERIGHQGGALLTGIIVIVIFMMLSTMYARIEEKIVGLIVDNQEVDYIINIVMYFSLGYCLVSVICYLIYDKVVYQQFYHSLICIFIFVFVVCWALSFYITIEDIKRDNKKINDKEVFNELKKIHEDDLKY